MSAKVSNNFSDIELVDLINKGEKKYFGVLYERYRDKVYSKCLTMCSNPDVAEDQAQDIMLKVLQSLNKFKGEAQFGTWLYAITYNHCIEYLRKHKRIRFDDWADLLEIPEEEDEEEVKRIMELREDRLVMLLEFLKPDDKAILLLRFWEGMELDRIQFILSIETKSALKMRLTRAVKRLQALYHKFHKIIPE